MGWRTSDTRNQPPNSMPHGGGRLYSSQLQAGSFTTLVAVANTLYALPIYIPERRTYTKIGLQIAAGVAGSARLGIFADADSIPGALELDAGTISTAAAVLVNITISKSLEPGWHWLAAVLDNTSTLVALFAAAGLDFLGFTTALDVTVHPGYSAPFTYAAFPSWFPGGETLISAAIPRVHLEL